MSASRRPRRQASGRLGDLAYARIKGGLIQCVFRPGTEVTEAQLTSRYRLGRAPVRNSLARLAQWLLRPLPRRGYLIARATLQGVQDIFGLRLVLEPALPRIAAGKVDSVRLRELDRICQAGYSPADPGAGTGGRKERVDG